MAEPTTTNIGLIIPNTGDLVGTWGAQALNPDLSAMDGYLGGVQTMSVSNAPVTLTAPSGFTASPTGGPTQAQNAVLRFTGALSANVTVTLPLPGYYIIENFTTNASYILIFAAATAGHVIAVDQGETQHIYSDGANVKFVNMGRVGQTEIWAGLTAMPAWVAACTVPPYLLNDGSIYNFSTFPYLGARLKSQFGGDGVTTFAVPDHRGRVALPYDGTGTRITAAGSGINGQVIGSAADNQSIALAASQIPTITGLNTNAFNSSGSTGNISTVASNGTIATGGGSYYYTSFAPATTTTNVTVTTGADAIAFQSNNTGGGAHANVQPSQVTGISVIRAA